MILFAFLFLVGFAITMVGGSYLIRAIRSRDTRRIALAAAVPSLYWLGWLGLFIADRPDYTRTMPQESALIGRWTATPKTLEMMTTKGHFSLTEHVITLGADHSIAMKNIPDCWRDYPPQPENMGKLGDWKGTWNVQPVQAVWGLDLSGPGPDGRPRWGCNGCLTLMHEKQPYELALHSGDVDSPIEMIFQREKE